MSYSIKEVFWTVQGEGVNAGRPAVFVRFAGCNLWNGYEPGRETGIGACAKWCDTDFAKGSPTDLDTLVLRMEQIRQLNAARFCVLTGGEPMLQVDAPLLEALRAHGWEVAVETNASVASRAGVNDLLHRVWLTVSPKLARANGQELPCSPDLLRWARELKVVVPGGDPGWTLEGLRRLQLAVPPSAALFLQPQDGPDLTTNVARTFRLVQELGAPWRVSAQGHKLLQLP